MAPPPLPFTNPSPPPPSTSSAQQQRLKNTTTIIQPPIISRLLTLLSTLYPNHQQITPCPASQQGACSYTFLAITEHGEKKVLQVRDKKKFGIERWVMEDVERVFGKDAWNPKGIGDGKGKGNETGDLVPKVLRMEDVDVEMDDLFCKGDDAFTAADGVGCEGTEEKSRDEESEDGKEKDMGARKTTEMRKVVLQMQIIEMTFLNGVSAEVIFSNERKMRRTNRRRKHDTRVSTLLSDLAGFFAVSWNNGVTGGKRKSNTLIASSIPTRLDLLATHLPSAPLRHIASATYKQVMQGGLDILPVVLTHGDFLPRNLLVDEETGRLKGVVDWGESEWLGFGVVVGGVEWLFGSVQKEEEGQGGEGGDIKVKFVYDDDADRLRGFFWGCLRGRIRELEDEEVWEAVMLARRVGILLWCGIAWDEGRRERVVGCGEEDEEDLACLEAFLEADVRGVGAKL